MDFTQLRVGILWLSTGSKRKHDCYARICIFFLSQFFNQRTTTPQFTPKIELTTLYTFDLSLSSLFLVFWYKICLGTFKTFLTFENY
jgi:hypothetical protein